MTVTLKCCMCDTEATATGGTEALLNVGWSEVHHRHCETCDCEDYFCPAHRAVADAMQRSADLRYEHQREGGS